MSVGWAGYVNGYLNSVGWGLPLALQAGPADTITLADGTVAHGGFNLFACLIALFVTFMLVIGTSRSAKFTSVLVIVKIIALTVFVVLGWSAVDHANFVPLMPNGWGQPLGGVGVLGAAASIFFAYVGFDAVSTAAEETKDPQKNIPIGLILSLIICTVFYLLVAYVAIGAMGAQPGGELSRSKEPLAFVMRHLGHPWIGNAVAASAVIALPSVILMMMFGQTRVLFTMSRDGLMPKMFSNVHPKFFTPHVVTIITGVFVAAFAACFPVDLLADVSNAGTLFAFLVVAIGVMILRKTDPGRRRSFRTPLLVVGGSVGRGGMPAAVRQPRHLHREGVLHLGGRRPGGLFQLRTQSQPRCQSGRRRGGRGS